MNKPLSLRSKVLLGASLALSAILLTFLTLYYTGVVDFGAPENPSVYREAKADALFELKNGELDQVNSFVIAGDYSNYLNNKVTVFVKTAQPLAAIEPATDSAAAQGEQQDTLVYVFPNVQVQALRHYEQLYLFDHPRFQQSQMDYRITSSLQGVEEILGLELPPAGVIRDAGVSATRENLLSFFGVLIPIAVIVGLILFLTRGNMSSNKTQVTMPKDIDGDMDDLIGMDDIKREVLQLEDMIVNRELYASYGVNKSFNVMMSGPAGTGKTKLASYLAKRLDVPLIYASASSLETGYVGGGPRTLKSLYKRASQFERAIIFLDEAETLMTSRKRETKGSRYEDDSITTLLSLLDGVDRKKDADVIWIVASNFDDAKMEMDEAMLRRFQLKINFRLPNHEERRAILAKMLESRSKDKCAADLDLDHIAGITSRMSPALLETLVDRASLIAIQENSQITQSILLQAFERVAVGMTDRATTGPLEEKRRLVAIHEAGHFLMQVHDAYQKNGCSTKNLRDYLNVIKISTESVSKMGALGFVLTKHEEVPLNTLAEFEARVRHLFGGSANEELFYGRSGMTSGAHNDFEQATRLMHHMVNEMSFYSNSKVNYSLLARLGVEPGRELLSRVESLSERLYSETREVLGHYKKLSQQIADELMQRYVLQLDEILPMVERFLEEETLPLYVEDQADAQFGILPSLSGCAACTTSPQGY